MEKKTLKVTLKKKWFDMEFHPDPAERKNHEYRHITPYWVSRLTTDFSYEHSEDLPLTFNAKFKQYDYYHAFNGGHFGSGLRNGIREVKSIYIGYGKPEWGAEPSKQYFVISLGELLKEGK